jgi:hypothetical protein
VKAVERFCRISVLAATQSSLVTAELASARLSSRFRLE